MSKKRDYFEKKNMEMIQSNVFFSLNKIYLYKKSNIQFYVNNSKLQRPIFMGIKSGD